MHYGGQDREFGERMFNLGIKSKQIRYSAIVLHLDHKTRKSLILNKLGTFEVAFHVLFFQPGEREGILTLYIVISKLFADIHRQFEVASR